MSDRQDIARDGVWWSAVTLPLSVAALFLYTANEWLFFVTKPSVLSVLPLRERVAALFTSGGTFVTGLLLVQLAATALAILIPRFRVVATVPAAFVLSCLVLMMLDNFTYTVLGFSSIRSMPGMRYGYALLLLCTAAVVARSLARRLSLAAGKRRLVAVIAVWLLALAPMAAAAVEHVRADEVFALPPQSTGPRVTPARPNVLLLASDGMPAERMSAYGYGHATTPFLESIRDQTLFCENAFSNAGTTYAALLTLLTGKLPTRTKVLYPPTSFQGEAAREHLPGMLRERGYRSLQLSIRHYADAADANLIGAFDLANYRWERVLGRADSERHEGGADAFVGEMVDRLETRLFHIWGIREAPDEYRQMTTRDRGSDFWGDARRVSTLLQFMESSPEPWLAHVHLLDTHEGAPAAPGATRVGQDDFDVNVRAADAWFERIFAALRKNGQLDRTIVVIHSDHGRNWETRERLPLMIRFPGGAHARREQRNVQLADVAPTILDSIGVDVPPWMDGLSLLRGDQLRDDRPIFAIRNVRTTRTRQGVVLANPAPPNYGATSAMVIVGSRWLRFDLETEATATGEVLGHTAAGRDPIALEEARRLLVAELARAGFRIGAAPRRLDSMSAFNHDAEP